MVDLGKILSEGFSIWKRNLNICMPFVFNTLMIYGLVVLTIAGVISAVPSLMDVVEWMSTHAQQVNDQTKIPPELLSRFTAEIARNLPLIVSAIVVATVLSVFINAFFTAGAIGMAKEAILRGRTSIADMSFYGARKFLSLLGADIIVALISLAGIVFLIPAFVLISPWELSKLSELSRLGTPETRGVLLTFVALLLLGIVLFVIYAVIISIMFALARYAVVIGDMSAIDGVKSAFHTFMENKLDVFLFWLIILVISGLAGFLLSFLGLALNAVFGSTIVGDVVGMIVSLIVIQPLIVVWWSRFYTELRPVSSILPSEQNLEM